MPKTKREVIINVAEVIAAQKDILTPLELAQKILGMNNVAAVDREAEFILPEGSSGYAAKQFNAALRSSGWTKEIR